MLEGFERAEKRHMAHPNLVPIIDLFTCIIFFLLLSTSFIALTKITVPPSKVSTITDPIAPPPLAPKILLTDVGPQFKLTLFWAGATPGQDILLIPKSGDLSSLEMQTRVLGTTQKLARQFNQRYPDEKGIQLGLGGGIPYQLLLSTMDGLKDVLPDVILISHEEAEARASQGGPENKNAVPDQT